MRKQSLSALAEIYALTVMGSEFLQEPFDVDQIIRDPLDDKPKVHKKIIPKGLKKYHYGDGFVYAINQKNADRKAKKLGYL